MSFPKFVMAVAIAVAPIVVNAQRIKLIEGDLSPLKGTTALNTEFTYDNLKVGDFKNEDDYIQKKKDDYNKKEAGRGDT